MTVDTIGTDTGRLEVVDSASGKLELDDLHRAARGMHDLTRDGLEISPGERIQILGAATSDKSMLFRRSRACGLGGRNIFSRRRARR